MKHIRKVLLATMLIWAATLQIFDVAQFLSKADFCNKPEQIQVTMASHYPDNAEVRAW